MREWQQSLAEAGSSPASMSGWTRTMKPPAWQPGEATRLPAHDGLAPLGAELREAVGPAGGYAVRRRGVHDAHGGVFYHRDRLAAGGVRQAEDGEAAGVERLAPCRRVFPRLAREGDEFEVVPALQPGVYAQPGRAGAAVYEYLCHAVTCFKYSICAAMFAGEAPPSEVRFATQAAREMSS